MTGNPISSIHIIIVATGKACRTVCWQNLIEQCRILALSKEFKSYWGNADQPMNYWWITRKTADMINIDHRHSFKPMEVHPRGPAGEFRHGLKPTFWLIWYENMLTTQRMSQTEWSMQCPLVSPSVVCDHRQLHLGPAGGSTPVQIFISTQCHMADQPPQRRREHIKIKGITSETLDASPD